MRVRAGDQLGELLPEVHEGEDDEEDPARPGQVDDVVVIVAEPALDAKVQVPPGVVA